MFMMDLVPGEPGNCFTRTTPDGGMQTEEKEVWYNVNVPSQAVLLLQNTEKANTGDTATNRCCSWT
jgi:hypothetical protein